MVKAWMDVSTLRVLHKYKTDETQTRSLTGWGGGMQIQSDHLLLQAVDVALDIFLTSPRNESSNPRLNLLISTSEFEAEA